MKEPLPDRRPPKPAASARTAPSVAPRGPGGVIAFRGVLGSAIAELGRRIVGGEWDEGAAIPTEAELSETLGVGRSVIREAFRILASKGMIRSRTSDGTRVLPRGDWRLLDPDVMQWRIAAGDTEPLLLDLLRVRVVLEPGVAREATLHAGPAARARILAAWHAKDAAFRAPDADLEARRARFIETDLEFHRAFLAAVDSPLLDQLFAVIETALSLLFDLQMRARGYDTGMVGIEEGHRWHGAVIDAFERGDAEGAHAAMSDLIGRAILDAHQGLAAHHGPARP